MKLIKPSFEIIEQQSGLDGLYKQIELAGRTCYKSEDKITPTSAKEFVDRMIKSGHGAMLEHGTVYLKVPYGKMDNNGEFENEGTMYSYHNNHYSIVKSGNDDNWYITTNYRVLVENDRLNDLMYLCDEPTEYHEKRICVRFICDRVTGESFLRHRSIDEDHPTVEGIVTRDMEKDINSFARESTRYCNYSKGKFGSELSIIQPPEFSDSDLDGYGKQWTEIYREPFRELCTLIANYNDSRLSIIDVWFFHALSAQWCYMKLIDKGWKAQQARRVLPLDIASPLVMTGFVSDWKHFFELRCDSSAHPQARELAVPLKEEFIKRGIIDF